MNPEILYRELADGVYFPEMFPHLSALYYQALYEKIKKYIQDSPRGCLAILWGIFTGRDVALQKLSGQIALIVGLDHDEVNKTIIAVTLISVGRKTPTEIHSKLQEGALKGIDKIHKSGGKANLTVVKGIGFAVLFAALLWKNRNTNVIQEPTKN